MQLRSEPAAGALIRVIASSAASALHGLKREDDGAWAKKAGAPLSLLVCVARHARGAHQLLADIAAEDALEWLRRAAARPNTPSARHAATLAAEVADDTGASKWAELARTAAEVAGDDVWRQAAALAPLAVAAAADADRGAASGAFDAACLGVAAAGPPPSDHAAAAHKSLLAASLRGKLLRADTVKALARAATEVLAVEITERDEGTVKLAQMWLHVVEPLLEAAINGQSDVGSDSGCVGPLAGLLLASVVVNDEIESDMDPVPLPWESVANGARRAWKDAGLRVFSTVLSAEAKAAVWAAVLQRTNAALGKLSEACDARFAALRAAHAEGSAPPTDATDSDVVPLAHEVAGLVALLAPLLPHLRGQDQSFPDLFRREAWEAAHARMAQSPGAYVALVAAGVCVAWGDGVARLRAWSGAPREGGSVGVGGAGDEWLVWELLVASHALVVPRVAADAAENDAPWLAEVWGDDLAPALVAASLDRAPSTVAAAGAVAAANVPPRLLTMLKDVYNAELLPWVWGEGSGAAGAPLLRAFVRSAMRSPAWVSLSAATALRASAEVLLGRPEPDDASDGGVDGSDGGDGAGGGGGGGVLGATGRAQLLRDMVKEAEASGAELPSLVLWALLPPLARGRVRHASPALSEAVQAALLDLAERIGASADDASRSSGAFDVALAAALLPGVPQVSPAALSAVERALAAAADACVDATAAIEGVPAPGAGDIMVAAEPGRLAHVCVLARSLLWHGGASPLQLRAMWHAAARCAAAPGDGAASRAARVAGAALLAALPQEDAEYAEPRDGDAGDAAVADDDDDEDADFYGDEPAAGESKGDEATAGGDAAAATAATDEGDGKVRPATSRAAVACVSRSVPEAGETWSASARAVAQLLAHHILALSPQDIAGYSGGAPSDGAAGGAGGAGGETHTGHAVDAARDAERVCMALLPSPVRLARRAAFVALGRLAEEEMTRLGDGVGSAMGDQDELDVGRAAAEASTREAEAETAAADAEVTEEMRREAAIAATAAEDAAAVERARALVPPLILEAVERALPTASDEPGCVFVLPFASPPITVESAMLSSSAHWFDPQPDDEAAEAAMSAAMCAFMLLLRRVRCATGQPAADLAALVAATGLLPPWLCWCFGHARRAGQRPGPRTGTVSVWPLAVDATVTPARGSMMRDDWGVEGLSQALVFCAAETLPGRVAEWFNGLDRGTSRFVERLVMERVTPALLAAQLRDVAAAAADGEWDPDEFSVTGSVEGREVSATYAQDEVSLQISVVVPREFPLRRATVVGGARVGVSEARWRRWELQMVTLLSMRDGSILDALRLWKRNVDQEFEGVEPCTICYSVVHLVRCSCRRACRFATVALTCVARCLLPPGADESSTAAAALPNVQEQIPRCVPVPVV